MLQPTEDLLTAWPESRLVVTLGLALLGMGPVVVAHWGLACPSGVLPSRHGRIGMTIVYVTGLANLPYVLYYPLSYLYVGPAPFDMTTYNRLSAVVVVAPVIVWLTRRTPHDRQPTRSRDTNRRRDPLRTMTRAVQGYPGCVCDATVSGSRT